MPYHTYKGNEVYYGKPGEMASTPEKRNVDMTNIEPSNYWDKYLEYDLKQMILKKQRYENIVFLPNEIVKPYVWDQNLTFNDNNYSDPEMIQDSMNVFFEEPQKLALFMNETGSIRLSLDVRHEFDSEDFSNLILNYTWKLHIYPVKGDKEIIKCSIKCDTVLKVSTSEGEWRNATSEQARAYKSLIIKNKNFGKKEPSNREITVGGVHTKYKSVTKAWHVSFENESSMERMDLYTDINIVPFENSLPEIEQKIKDASEKANRLEKELEDARVNNKQSQPFLLDLETKAKAARRAEDIESEAAKRVQETIHLTKCAQLLKVFSKKCGFENNQHWIHTLELNFGVGVQIQQVRDNNRIGDLSQMVMNMFLHLISYTVTRARLRDVGMDKNELIKYNNEHPLKMNQRQRIEWRHAYVLVLWASDKEVDDRKRPTG